MTDFKDTFVGKALSHFSDWAAHLYHTATAQQLISVGEDVGKQVIVSGLTAGMAAKSANGDKAAVTDAVKNAMLHTAGTVGVTVGLSEIEALTSHISDSMHTPDAPLPPA